MKIIVPKVGLTVEELEVTVWHKQPGDTVTEGEIVCEVAADKADLEIAAPASGVLGDILITAGTMAAPGDVLAHVQVDGEPGVAPDAGDGTRVETPPAAPTVVTGDGAAHRDLRDVAQAGARLRISPVARRAAEHHRVTVAAINGSGPMGRILLRDIEAFLQQAPPPTASVPEQVQPEPTPSDATGAARDLELVEVRWSAARRATARLMAHSNATVAPVTLHRRAGTETAMVMVKRLKSQGLPATFTHAILAAVAYALPNHPALNAIWDGDHVKQARQVNIGLAVDDGGDLLLATVGDADRRDLTSLVVGAVEAVTRARAREAAGPVPTFSVSNLGMVGVEQFTPIVTPPQVAVLGVGAIVDARCHLSLTFDHRAVDGAPAARFLAEICDRLIGFDGR